MRLRQTPVALPPLLCSDFIDFLLKHHNPPTTLIICSTREAFLEDLLASIRDAPSREPSGSQASDEHASQHSLLIPTIHLIAKSQGIHVVFVPSLPHLRALLATRDMVSMRHSASMITNSTFRSPLLAIWGMANLHHSTAEYSAQGLARTLAAAVEAASHGQQRLVLAEPPNAHDGAEQGDVEVTEGVTRDAWKEQVPLLSGSVRFGGEERAWAGKTIEVGIVVAKWCSFIRLKQEG